MRKKGLLEVIIGVSLVALLAVAFPLIGCAPSEQPPEEEVIIAKIGVLAPLTGYAAPWGLPGLWGDEIWAENLNEAGGIVLPDGSRVLVELVPYDNEYIGSKALTGARKLVLEDNVCYVQMAGGHTSASAVPFLTQQKIMSSTLGPFDFTPDFPYHIAPVEVLPLTVVPPIEWIAEQYPELRTFAHCCQDDEIGRATKACALAAAEAVGFEIVYNEMFDMEVTDFAPIMSAILATDPDIICLSGCYSDFVDLLVEQAYLQGYEGHLDTGVLDFPQKTIDKTSVKFMEGTTWAYPEFDDPSLTPEQNAFYYEFDSRHPGQCSGVAWEFPACLDVWKFGVEKAGSIDSMEVFRALKSSPTVPHVFGPGVWWGKAFWSQDNALMADWPVVQMHDGKGRIVGYRSMVDFWNRNKEIAVKWQEEYGMMWYQRL